MSTERAARDSQHGRLKLLIAGVGFTFEAELRTFDVDDKIVHDFLISFVGGVKSLRFSRSVVDIYACGTTAGSFFILRVKSALMNGC